MKVILNKGTTGFDVSQEVFEYLINKKGWKALPLPEKDEDFDSIEADIFIIDGKEYDFAISNTSILSFRMDPDLVEAIEHVKNPGTKTSFPVVIDVENDEDLITIESVLISEGNSF